MRNLMKNVRREGGFTLVELLVVVIIVVALAAIAVPIVLANTGDAETGATKTNLNNVAAFFANSFGANAAITENADNLVSSMGQVSTAGLSGVYDEDEHTFCYETTDADAGPPIVGWHIANGGVPTAGPCA